LSIVKRNSKPNLDSQKMVNRVIDYAVKRFITKSTWAEIRTAYASGIGLREIARNMGIPAGTILSRAKREGWSREIQNAKALAKRDDAANAITPFEAASASMQQRGERHVKRMAGVSERGVDHIETMDGPEILRSIDGIEKLDKVARSESFTHLGVTNHSDQLLELALNFSRDRSL
jgi:hypothetical protein